MIYTAGKFNRASHPCINAAGEHVDAKWRDLHVASDLVNRLALLG